MYIHQILLFTIKIMKSMIDLRWYFNWLKNKNLPNEVSALKLCLVPLLDSNKNPGKSSFRMVLCICPSVFTTDSSPAFLKFKQVFKKVGKSYKIGQNYCFFVSQTKKLKNHILLLKSKNLEAQLNIEIFYDNFC